MVPHDQPKRLVSPSLFPEQANVDSLVIHYRNISWPTKHDTFTTHSHCRVFPSLQLNAVDLNERKGPYEVILSGKEHSAYYVKDGTLSRTSIREMEVTEVFLPKERVGAGRRAENGEADIKAAE